MEEEILHEILQEMKGFRSDLSVTNSRLSNLETKMDETNKRLDGLNSSLVIMQQAYTDVKFVVTQIKDFLSDRVIWDNDSISIETGSGSSIHGTIHKGDQP